MDLNKRSRISVIVCIFALILFFPFESPGFGPAPKLILPTPLAETGGAIDFEPSSSGLAFSNYSEWKNSPALSSNLYHCASLAVLARQFFLWADFKPGEARLSAKEYRRLIKKIWKINSTLIPGSRARVPVPGYKDLYDFSSETENIDLIKDVLGDAIAPAFRPGWNWNPFDVFENTNPSRRFTELNLRQTLSRGRQAVIYLTDGFKSAHSILLYRYENLGSKIIYQTYDSNHPGHPIPITFDAVTGKVYHPDLGLRDPWILYPFSDEPMSLRENLNLAKIQIDQNL